MSRYRPLRLFHVITVIFLSVRLSQAFYMSGKLTVRLSAACLRYTDSTFARACVGQNRQASSRSNWSRRGRVQLAGEALTTGIGIVIGGATVIAVGRGLTTLASAFNLADYRTTSGHDLRLNDRRLHTQCRRNIHPLTGRILPVPAASSMDDCSRGAILSSFVGEVTEEEEEVVDWREEVRRASRLPDVKSDPVAESGSNKDIIFRE